jgi:hypothetical protein
MVKKHYLQLPRINWFKKWWRLQNYHFHSDFWKRKCLRSSNVSQNKNTRKITVFKLNLWNMWHFNDTTTLSLMTISTTTFCITTVRMMDLIATLCINAIRHNATRHLVSSWVSHFYTVMPLCWVSLWWMSWRPFN